ncbi:MAG: ATP-binding protein [Acidobacteria bacterium]|jgi:two-component system NtrC family sensor kinase|nr:ATP-binding protein [Acidobacteriota bacterium]
MGDPASPAPKRTKTGRPGGDRRRLGVATKLVLALCLIVVGVFGTILPASLWALERDRRSEVLAGADQLSRAIVNATWRTMLADQRQEVYEAMRIVGREPGIEAIRLINKGGLVTFSTGGDTGTVLAKGEDACRFCHEAAAPLIRVGLKARSRVTRDARGHRRIGIVTPIYNDTSCSGAACHRHPASAPVLGVLDVVVSLDRVDREIASARARSVLISLALMVLAGGAGFVLVRRTVGRPVHELIDATRAMTADDLGRAVEVRGRDELGELAAAFNGMRERLRAALEDLNELNRTLEGRVDERTRELRVAYEGMARSDRLASLGQLSASVAHEINNPLAGVLNYAMLMERILTPDGIPPGRAEEFRRYLQTAAQETARVGRIVTSLLSFARQSTPQRAPHDLEDLVRSTVPLVAHRLELQGTALVQDFRERLPVLSCDGSQLRQVILNLVLNAAEALRSGGAITVRGRRGPRAGTLTLEVDDDGPGIPPEILGRVFDPFFTTKAEGGGTGLGLPVVFGIVSAHGGSIELTNRPGGGARATVVLPLEPPPAALEGPPTAATAPPEGGVR